MNKLVRIVVLLIIGIGVIVMVANAQSSWPKEIPLDNGGKITIYQPQPENLNGNFLSARAAVSIAKTTSDNPIFGAIWFDATLQTDKDSRTATLESIDVKQAKFPAIKDEQQLQSYTETVENEVPKWNMQFSLDQLLTSIQQTKQLNDPNLKNDAPNVIYRDKPTTLVIIDGEPKLQLDKTSQLQKVINTPSTIVLNQDDNLYYLYGGGLWYRSSSILSGWTNANNLPTRIQALDAQIQQKSKDGAANTDEKPVTPTDILVSTQPAELIQTEGTPTYQTIDGTSLLYVNNSLNDIFKDINSQQNYILIAGRWYSSTSLKGGWSYVPANQLPADFAKIPEGTEKDGVLSSVAGTNAADEALMDAQIPQTAKVDRKTATTTVTYDGSPIFNPINGTGLLVAENSNITVLKSNGRYYAVDNGIWFISNAPSGPWQVSTDRPEDVNNIPPDNIAYNTKYVYVYNATPDYVYAGYTPGYLGCYAYGGTVVWGTGWYYRPWYRHSYFARPYTWGFGMTYNPWTGWNIAYQMGYSLGWHYYDNNPYCRGWFGPRTYHPPYRVWGFNGGYYGRKTVVINQPNIVINRPVHLVVNNRREVFESRNHSINLYNRAQGARTIDIDRRQGTFIDKNPPKNNHFDEMNNRGDANKPNVYHPQQGNVSGTKNFPKVTHDTYGNNRPIAKPDVQGNNNVPDPQGNAGGNKNFPKVNHATYGNNRPFARPSTQNNNISADPQGNVYKKDDDGWKQRENRNWRPATPAQTPDLNRVQQQRDRGNDREKYYRNSTPAPAQPQRTLEVPRPSKGSNSDDKGGHRRG